MPPSPTPLSARTRQAYEALGRWIIQQHGETGLLVLGINGAQGSGKSTLAAFLVKHLADQHRLNAVVICIDDFYLSRAARAQLAATVHPLLVTRGVPGTHDITRGRACLQQLRNLQPRETCRLPQFSKATDEALGPEHDRLITQPPDLVLFEGWCVGTPPQDAAALAMPINDVERTADSDGRWRHYVNQQLAGPYAQWFAELDALVYLQVPGWEQVRGWRAQQERETAERSHGHSVFSGVRQLDHFIQHYQRLTHHALEVLPQSADVVLRLGLDHVVISGHYA